MSFFLKFLILRGWFAKKTSREVVSSSSSISALQRECSESQLIKSSWWVVRNDLPKERV